MESSIGPKGTFIERQVVGTDRPVAIGTGRCRQNKPMLAYALCKEGVPGCL
jgi:hypothetical protein